MNGNDPRSGADSSNEMPRDDALRALYRRLPPDEPRAETDDVIRAAARQAVALQEAARRVESGPARWRSRWQVPLALAATLVLTLVILRDEPPQYAALDELRGLPAAETPVDASVESPVEASAGLHDESSGGEPPAADAAAKEITETTRQASGERSADEKQKRADGAPNRQSAEPVSAAPVGSSVPAAPPSLASREMQDARNRNEYPALSLQESDAAALAEIDKAVAANPSLVRADQPAGEKREAGKNAAAETASAARAKVASPSVLAAAPEVSGAVTSVAPALQKREAPAKANESIASETDWPFSIAPDTPASDACAKLQQAFVGECSSEARAAGALVLLFQPRDSTHFEADWTARLHAAGWQETVMPSAPPGAARVQRRFIREGRQILLLPKGNAFELRWVAVGGG